MTPLPRSALLALWAGPVLSGSVGADVLLRAVQGEDEPHEVCTQHASGWPPLPGPGRLPALLDLLRDEGVRALRLVLPAPGDPSTLPGPRAVNETAVDAGECVLTVGGPPLALVPQVQAFGSVHERGHQVRWQVLDCAAPAAPSVSTVPEVERELREALAEATAVLTDLDVGRWRPDAAARLDGLRSTTASAQVPRSTPPRAARVLDLAWRVRSIVELAREDHGGAVTGWEATQRDETLRQLESVSRRAVVAAVNAPLVTTG